VLKGEQGGSPIPPYPSIRSIKNKTTTQVSSKPFFKRLVNSKRCVVVLDGCVFLVALYLVCNGKKRGLNSNNISAHNTHRFYEWVTDKLGQKQPYFVRWEDDRPMTVRFRNVYISLD
jgi:hypothetical protein